MQKRDVDLLVISDVHLGTYGCHARELLQYLSTIQPAAVVLNGDIIDAWQFSKRYWPAAHMKVVQHILGLVAMGVPVTYIPGNHDEVLRRFKGFSLGSLRIENKLSLKIDGHAAWIFHGDAFDVVMQHSKWLARLGAIGYDALILINRCMNWISDKLGRGRISLSKSIKEKVKSAVSFISKFEDTVCGIAAENRYQYVICGHIHQPEIRHVITKDGPVTYLNSGDWIENLTSLEYTAGKWRLYRYAEDAAAQSVEIKETGNGKSSFAKAAMESLLHELHQDTGMTGDDNGYHELGELLKPLAV